MVAIVVNKSLPQPWALAPSPAGVHQVVAAPACLPPLRRMPATLPPATHHSQPASLQQARRRRSGARTSKLTELLRSKRAVRSI